MKEALPVLYCGPGRDEVVKVMVDPPIKSTLRQGSVASCCSQNSAFLNNINGRIENVDLWFTKDRHLLLRGSQLSMQR